MPELAESLHFQHLPRAAALQSLSGLGVQVQSGELRKNSGVQKCVSESDLLYISNALEKEPIASDYSYTIAVAAALHPLPRKETYYIFKKYVSKVGDYC